MRAKPEMKPWVSTDKSKMSSVGAALTARVLGHLLWGCAAPPGLNQWLENEKPRANALGFQRLFRNLQYICYNSLKLGLFFESHIATIGYLIPFSPSLVQHPITVLLSVTA